MFRPPFPSTANYTFSQNFINLVPENVVSPYCGLFPTSLHWQSWDVSFHTGSETQGHGLKLDWGRCVCFSFAPITNSYMSIFRSYPVTSVLQKARDLGLVFQLFLLQWWIVAILYLSACWVPLLSRSFPSFFFLFPECRQAARFLILTIPSC